MANPQGLASLPATTHPDAGRLDRSCYSLLVTPDEHRHEADRIRTNLLRDCAIEIRNAELLGEAPDRWQDLSVWVVEASDREVIDEYEATGGDVDRMQPRPR